MVADSMNVIQSSLKCCGAENKTDWKSMNWNPTGETKNKVIPLTEYLKVLNV